MMQFDVACEHWSNFRASIHDQLERTPTERLRDAWSAEAERTAFYMGDLLPRVASDLKLETGHELFRVDMAMGVPSPMGIVLLVWIESENDLAGITHEMRK